MPIVAATTKKARSPAVTALSIPLTGGALLAAPTRDTRAEHAHAEQHHRGRFRNLRRRRSGGVVERPVDLRARTRVLGVGRRPEDRRGIESSTPCAHGAGDGASRQDAKRVRRRSSRRNRECLDERVAPAVNDFVNALPTVTPIGLGARVTVWPATKPILFCWMAPTTVGAPFVIVVAVVTSPVLAVKLPSAATLNWSMMGTALAEVAPPRVATPATASAITAVFKLIRCLLRRP